MRNYRFAFYATEKVRTHNWGKLLAQGAKVHGDVVDIHKKDDYTGPLADYDGCCNMGLSRAASRLRDGYLGANKFFMFFDKGYTDRSKMRVSLNAWQPLAYFQRFMRPDDRFLANKMHLSPRRKRDNGTKVVLLAGSCQNYANFMDLGNVNDYNLGVLQELRANTDRKIVYRPNPSWYTKHHDEFVPIHEQVENAELSDPNTGFKADLERTHLLVTHGTGAAVAAVASGIGSMVLGPGICRPLSLTEKDYDKIETPNFPKDSDRHQFFADLHYCQWSEEEYRNGAAWADIRLVLAALTEKKEPISSKELLSQYQLMHQHPLYFRGLSTLKYADQIGELFIKHRVGSVLDYGSGKGDQYQNPYYLRDQWEAQSRGTLAIQCYDPAVVKYSKPPKGVFDAVICCDVMEHIPEASIPVVLQDILRYAKKVVFLAVATSPAVKTMPDGRNCHVTVRPREWWQTRIDEAMAGVGRQLEVVLVTTARDEDDKAS